MSNRLEELHAECKKYHLKKLLKAVLLLAFIGIVVVAAFFFANNFTQELPEISKKKIEIPSNKNVAKQEDYTLSVSSDDVAEAVEKMQRKKPVKKEVQTVKRQKTVQVSSPTEKKAIFVKELPKQTFFTAINEEKSLDNWIEKYNKKKSYALAIYIAKQYYFDSDYKNSSTWAKRANQLDRNKEEAWLFYAKSVYALGDVKKAKRILNIYLQYKDSNKAEFLLSEWAEKGN